MAFSAVRGGRSRGDGHLVGAVEALVAVGLGVLHVVLAASRDRRVHLLRHRHGLLGDKSIGKEKHTSIGQAHKVGA